MGNPQVLEVLQQVASGMLTANDGAAQLNQFVGQVRLAIAAASKEGEMKPAAPARLAC